MVPRPGSNGTRADEEAAGEADRILQYSIHSVPPDLRSLVGTLLPQSGDGWGKTEMRWAAARVGEAWSMSVEDVIVEDVGMEGAEIEKVRMEDVRTEEVRVEYGGLEGVKRGEVRVEDVKIVVTFQCSDVPLWPIHNNSSSSAAGASAAAAAAVSEVANADGASAHAGMSPADSATATQADVSRAMNRLLFNFRLFQQQLCEHIWAAGHWADAVDPLTGYLMHSASGSSGSSAGRSAGGGGSSVSAEFGAAGSSGGAEFVSTGIGAGCTWPFPSPIKYNEVDVAQILLGYPVAPTATATSLLTTAPLPLLQSAIRHVAGSGWRLPGWQEEEGVVVVGQGTGDGKMGGVTAAGKGAEGGSPFLLPPPALLLKSCTLWNLGVFPRVCVEAGGGMAA
ncbi:unnamed protein product [Closterium sp. Naga37s-1]|nr:unnamed protein product [Closterium sp. Naga37s-1]